MRTAYTDEGYASFQEETLGALEDMDPLAVVLADGDNQIRVVASAADAERSIGVIRERYDGNSPDIQVALFNKEGSFRGLAGGTIPKGSLVGLTATGSFEVAASAAVSKGIYIGNEEAVTGDVIEILTK